MDYVPDLKILITESNIYQNGVRVAAAKWNEIQFIWQHHK